MKEQFEYLVRELDVDIDAIPFHEKDEYLWRDSYETMSIDERKKFIQDCAILIQRLENLQAEFLEKYTTIHEEAVAIAEKSVVAEEKEAEVEEAAVETVVVTTAAEAIAVGSATMTKTGTNTTIGINIANTISKVTQEVNSVKRVVKQQSVSIVDRIKSTVQKICGAIKDTVVEVKNTAVDIATRIKLTIAAIAA